MSLLRRIFFGWPFLVLLLLVLLCFFQHPSSDDFAGNLLTKTMGLRGAIGYYLSDLNGRFSSIPLFLLFTSSRFLMDHYFMGLVFFLLLTYLALWYFLRYVLKEFYTLKKPAIYYHWLTAFSLVVLLACMPEPSSFFTWLAADTTYLISFILFLFYLVKLHQVFVVPRAARQGADRLVLLLLVVLLCGANEITLFFSLLFSVLLCGYRFIILKNKRPFIFVLPAVHVLVIVLGLFLSGNVQRSGAYVQKQFWLFSLTGAFYQTIQVFFSIFSNPLFWLAALWMGYNSKNTKAAILIKTGHRLAVFAATLLLLFAAVWALCFAARHLTGIVLPFRSRNIIVCIVVPAMLASAVVLIGPLLPALPVVTERPVRFLFLLAGTLVLVFNSFTAGLCQSLVDAPIHKQVLDDRIAQLKAVKARGGQKVVFNAYRDDFLTGMKKKYGEKAALFFNVEFPSPPHLLYFLDDPAEQVRGALYGEYYGIDTLQLDNNISVRMGLLPGVWQQGKP